MTGIFTVLLDGIFLSSGGSSLLTYDLRIVPEALVYLANTLAEIGWHCYSIPERTAK